MGGIPMLHPLKVIIDDLSGRLTVNPLGKFVNGSQANLVKASNLLQQNSGDDFTKFAGSMISKALAKCIDGGVTEELVTVEQLRKIVDILFPNKAPDPRQTWLLEPGSITEEHPGAG